MGQRALEDNTIGNDNSAFGNQALGFNTTGDGNSAFGFGSLGYNTAGLRNSAVGYFSLLDNTTGNDNIAIGFWAGRNQTTGSDNIYLDNSGVAAESGQIKIGTVGTHTDAFIAGIDSNVVAGSAVLVTASGELGVAVSSARYKESVRAMAADSEVLLALSPVTFQYREEVNGAGDSRQYGLLAEEVAEVAPDLVRYDAAGAPFSVHYHLLAPMLLNEMQKQQRVIESQGSTIEELRGHNAEQRALISSLLERVEGLEAREAIEASGLGG